MNVLLALYEVHAVPAQHMSTHGSCQDMPPVEYEAAFHMKNEPANMVEA